MIASADELAYASVKELRELVESRQVTVEELVRTSIDRIARLNPALNAVVAVRAEEAITEARAADRVAADSRGPLHGVPFSVKDVTETLDLPTTYGSIAFRDNRTDFEAAIVSQLRSAGGILVCKTTTPELACEPVTRSELHGETRNPWSLDRTPGGSSGGAAAGLAAGLYTLAQGTDAGGSIRIPASCCGVVGIKPTRGLVSLEPAGPDTWGGFLHHGPLARTVRDAAAMLDAMSAPSLPDRRTTTRSDRPFSAACGAPVPQLRIAYTQAVPGAAVDEDVAASFADALEIARALGSELTEAAPDFRPLAEPFITIICVAFAGIGAEMTDEQLSQIGPKCLALMKRGWAHTGAEYYNAQQAVHREASKVLNFWRDYDLLLTPTVPMVPPMLKAFPSTEDHDAKWAEYGHWETFTAPANVTGQPAISLPCRKPSSTGVPIGIQMIGRLGAEVEMLAFAAAYEAATGWSQRRPPLSERVEAPTGD
jgi:amidase/aspartyl-tRNA(Asn)/glutamyl-tRNA(Gln) amidotransferase subunit A